MRIIIIFAMLALFTIALVSCERVPVEVGGDLGRAWLKIIQSQSETTSVKQDKTSGLWSWGGVPKGHKLINGTLEPDMNITNDTTYEWLWVGEWRKPLVINSDNSIPKYGLSPYYSDDPWILAQQLERPISTPLSWLPQSIIDTFT
ncbi:MAG: hypothetical protein ACXQT4_04675 [Methanotrichaceae archaeon]